MTVVWSCPNKVLKWKPQYRTPAGPLWSDGLKDVDEHARVAKERDCGGIWEPMASSGRTWCDHNDDDDKYRER